jgi:bile acid-coenzyme A ligase
VHPTEVERVLEQHPAVRSAVAFGVPDPDLGQRIEAAADVGSLPISAGDLSGWLRSRLDPSRRPSVIHIVNDPLRNDAGKTNRKQLVRRFAPARLPSD